MECLEDTHAGRKHWGLVLYGIKSKLLAYYRLGSKNPTTSLNLDNLGNFKADDGIPIMITTDSDGGLGAGKKWKHYLGQMFTPF